MFWQNAYAGTISLPKASEIAGRVDILHDFLIWLSIFFTVLLTVIMIVFIFKYGSKNKGRKTEYILGSHFLELLWTVVPLILMLFIFAWGYRDYLDIKVNNTPEIEVNVTGRQWMWNFEYPNGRKTLNQLFLPVGKQTRLIMTSEDVLHSLFIPNFRTKQDVVPGMFTKLDFKITEHGVHPIYCTEYCGTGHSDMLAIVVAMEQQAYDKWLLTGKVPAELQKQIDDNPPSGIQANKLSATAKEGSATSVGMPAAEKGKQLFTAKACFGCHSTDGSAKVGPSLKGVFGTDVELQTGEKVKADENYMKESMLNPSAKVVKGFAPSMPPFAGQLSDEEVSALIAYIKSLK